VALRDRYRWGNLFAAPADDAAGRLAHPAAAKQVVHRYALAEAKWQSAGPRAQMTLI